MRYTSSEKIELFIGKEISTSFVDYINAAERYINQYTGRNFTAGNTEALRQYNGTNTRELFIDDCIEITKVEVGDDYYGDTFTEVTDYLTMPANNTALNVPVNKLWLKDGVFQFGIQNHQITAKWGYSEEAPDDIVWATTFLASSIYKSGSSGVGGVKSEKIGDFSVSFNNDKELTDFNKVQTILDKYKRFRV